MNHMGVPSLYRTLVSNYNSIQDVSSVHTEYLFIDFNCLIHHCLHVVKGCDISMREMEEEVITEIIRYAVYIITKVIMPSRVVYISIDGPVPIAKMERQRSRRFKKIQDASFASKTRRKYNMDDDKSFDSNRITPGTMFMSKLNSRLKNYITIGAFASHSKSGTPFKVICSDSNVPGEGEFKIFEYIRNSPSTPKVLIYGMDADLIILSMAVKRPHIRLMREATHIDNTSMAEFSYIDIDNCKTALYDEYISDEMKTSLSIDAFIRDFIVYSMFGGNDYVHPLPHCKIRNGGLEKLVRVYVVVFSVLNRPMTSVDGDIDPRFMKAFLKRLADTEDIGVKQHMTVRRTVANHEPLTFEKEIEMYEHSDYSNPRNPFHLFYKDELSILDYNKPYDEWVNSYNAHFFDTPLIDVVSDYMKSLVWACKYYNGHIQSWSFHNRHRTSPTLKSIVELFDASQLLPSFNLDEVLTPIEQLLYVLPSHSSRLLPIGLQEMMTDPESPIFEYYPSKFKLDAAAGCKNVYAEAILPKIFIPHIRRVVANIPLNDHDMMRNRVIDAPFHKTFS